MNDSELTNALEKYGFSPTEAATYLAVLRHGEVTIRDLAEAADVSVRHAYDITERLQSRGFVVVDDHVTPTVVRGTLPSDAISRLQQELTTIQWELNSRMQDQSHSREIEVIKTQSTLLDRIRENITRAEDEITLSIPGVAIPEIAADLREALDRGVFVLLLATGMEGRSIDAGTVASSVRVWEERAPALMTVDTLVSLVAPPDMFERTNSQKQSIYFKQYQLTPILISAFLGNYWRSGREQAIARPGDLPREYTEFRHAVFDATCHLRRETDLHAEIKARPVGSPQGFETVTGRVEDTRQTLIQPRSSSLAVENSLLVEIDGTVRPVGGDGAFLEEYSAKRVRLNEW